MVHIAVLDTYIDSGKRERKMGKKYIIIRLKERR